MESPNIIEYFWYNSKKNAPFIHPLCHLEPVERSQEISWTSQASGVERSTPLEMTRLRSK